MRLFNGQAMYIERDGDQCIMRPKMRSEDDHKVNIHEVVTRRINGRTYTVTRFTIPRKIVSALKIDKGDTVDVYERPRRDRHAILRRILSKSANYALAHFIYFSLPSPYSF